jgi:hypothetical protein
MGGFVYDAINDTGFTAIRVPGAAYTEVLGANDSGSEVGYYADTSGKIHGFILGHRGNCAVVPVLWTGSGKNKLRPVAG